jgi:predicted alpha/beta-fold hydrolase
VTGPGPAGPRQVLDGPRLVLERPGLACLAPPWARGGHLQTLAAQFLPSPTPVLPWERTRLDLDDGDALALRMLPGTTDLVVHLFHGLGGSADGHYLRRASARLRDLGHTVVAVNHRGAGEGAGWARRPYHSGATRDLEAVLAFGKARFPGRRHLAVGFSISANILLLLLGRGGQALPDAALAVNPPVDLEACSRRLVTGFNRVYDQYFVRRLRKDVLARPGAPALPATPTLRAFDAVYTAAQAGFPTRDAYYAQCSCGPHLGGIAVPTVILSSLNDPFAPGGDLDRFPPSPAVHVHLEATGGHMGYLSRNVAGYRWLEYALAHYVQALAGAQGGGASS